MDRKIEEAIKKLESASRELIEEFICILNKAQPDQEKYEKRFEKWVEAKLELEQLGMSMGIGEFEFKYTVYDDIQAEIPKRKKILPITQEDNKFLKSLKIKQIKPANENEK